MRRQDAKKLQLALNSTPQVKLRAMIDAAERFNASFTELIARDEDGKVLSVAVYAEGGDAVALVRFLKRREKIEREPKSKLKAALAEAKETLKLIVDLANEGLIAEVGSPDHSALEMAETALALVCLALRGAK